MKPEDIQHGGNHYKDQPKHLQPIYLAAALKLNPIEYSILKYLLRHRKKGGLLDVQKMMHFGQMLLQEEYGVETEIKYLGELIDAEFELVAEAKQAVAAEDSLPQLKCPFRISDVVEHYDRAYSAVKWKIIDITSDRMIVVSSDPYELPSYIERAFWRNYRLAASSAIDNAQSTC